MAKGHLFAPFEWVKNQIKILEQKINDCFQSVSDGKALVASAITDQGVTTASDATFETMATNITAIPYGKCIKLTLSSGKCDVKTICENNGIDYTKLTTDNFIVGASKASEVQTGWSDAYQQYGHASGFTITKEYANGILTVGGNSQNIRTYSAGTGWQTAKKQTMTVFAYLVYTG